MIKQEIANVPENSIIFNEAQEYPLRSFTFDPIIYFNEKDQVWICGVELAALDYTGTKVIISLYSAIFEDEKNSSHMNMLEGEHVAHDGPNTAYENKVKNRIITIWQTKQMVLMILVFTHHPDQLVQHFLYYMFQNNLYLHINVYIQ